MLVIASLNAYDFKSSEHDFVYYESAAALVLIPRAGDAEGGAAVVVGTAKYCVQRLARRAQYTHRPVGTAARLAIWTAGANRERIFCAQS